MFLLPYIVAGLTTGSVYGLAGVGLVLTYKTTRIFNFAYGALATVSAFLFYTLHVTHGMAWPLAALICLVVTGPGLGIVLELLGRRISDASLTTQVVSTIGILLIVEAGVLLIYGDVVTRSVPQYLGAHVFKFGSVLVMQSEIVVWIIGLAATVGLWIFFRRARLGAAMRAVVDGPDLLDLSGTSPRQVRRWAWCIGVTFAAASGLLLAPLITLDGTTLTLLVVQAFGAAAIGRFTNLPMTYIGGLVLGVAASLATDLFSQGLLSNLPAALPFVILFIVLLVAPKRRLAEPSLIVSRSHAVWRAPAAVQWGGAGLLLVFLIAVPSFVGIQLDNWTLFLAGIIMFLSLGLLVRTSGQVSLCQVSFGAIGAAGLSHLAAGDGLPWVVAILLTGLIAVPIGALLAIPAVRLPGLYLALATFGFGVLLSYMFYSENYMFGFDGNGLTEPRPSLSWLSLNSDKGYYYVVLLITVVVAVGVVMLVRSRLGRLLRALGDSPTGLATSGTSIQVTRVVVFCISAFLAAISGALAGGAVNVVTPASYAPLISLTYFALVVIVVGGEPWYALLAAAGIWLVPSYLQSANTSIWLELLFGVFAILYALTPPSMSAVPNRVMQVLDRLRRPARESALTPESISARPVVQETRLDVADLRVQFGGLVAVDNVSLTVRTGQVAGLIGPNGAGKTTTFNACSGLNRPSAGKVLLNGSDISNKGPAARARSGLGRTFQQMELYDSLTVRQNVALGAEASFAGPNALTHLLTTRSQGRLVRRSAEDALERCDLSDLAERPAGSLSTGQRRLVELARCLAGPFRLLLLDEPSSGLDRIETRRFGQILKSVVSDWGVGILLVEHDLELVTEVCDFIYVLDFGRMIFEGSPAEVMSSDVVQAAYLGTDDSRLVENSALGGI